MKKSLTVRLMDLRCSCGGTLHPFKFEGGYDATIELGLPALAKGSFWVVKCDRCKSEALPGTMLEFLSEEAVLLLLKLGRRLSGVEARFLRKAAVAIGQADLADRLGVTRVTVARWEGSKSLSAEHDFQLRALVLHHLVKKSRMAGAWKKHRSALIGILTNDDMARKQEAPRKPPPLRLAA
jgi:DNA-binding transcriptional regulator YiaG